MPEGEPKDRRPRSAIFPLSQNSSSEQGAAALLLENRLLDSLHRAQTRYIATSNSTGLFDHVLDSLLQVTRSEYGFIGEVLHDDEGQPFLRTHAMTNIAWDAQTQALYQKHLTEGLEFRNLETLFGQVMATQRVVIANAPSSDPRRGGLPPGHPSLSAFLGLPFEFDGKMVGMVGLANRPGGYDSGIIRFLRPPLETCGHILQSYRNLLARQAAEAALREEKERYEDLVENLSELIQTTDAEGRIQYVNAVWREALGHAESRGLDVWTIVAPQSRASLRAGLDRLAEESHLHGMDLTLVAQDGELVEVEANIVARLEEGCIREVRYYLRDVTAARRAEREIERLRQAAQQRERLADVGVLTAKIVHDLSNPLAALSMVSQGIKRKIERQPEGAASALAAPVDRLIQTTTHLDAILSDFKDFARGQALRLSPVDLSAIVRDLAVLWRPVAEHRGVELRISVKTPFPTITGDLEKIRRATENLLKNAIEAREQGRGSIEVSLTPAPGGGVLLRVSDDGPGVPEGIDPFALFVSSKATGTGLGLPICRQIVEAHGGHLEHRPGYPCGAVFEMTLPKRPVPEGLST